MRTRSTTARSADLERIQHRFERWRAKKRPGTRIPGDLWRAAVNLARDISVSQTARHLRLDYYALKERVEAAPWHAAGKGGVGEFVEIPVSAVRHGAACVLEIQNGADVRVRMELQGMAAAELGSLVRSVLGATG